mgnify:CR=1 FL=1|tara:strand:- start:1877 stop:2116 length:240 start_codon:yes stop_codon:yes gene_type:complete
MSEILKGARYTFGGLMVLTVWSFAMVEFAQWKLDYQANHQTAEQIASDDALLRFGPGENASEATVQRYFDLMVEEKSKE